MSPDRPAPQPVAYVISVPQHGAGGHYHSLAAIVGTLNAASLVRPTVVMVGRVRSPAVDALSAEGVPVSFVPFDGWNLPGALAQVTEGCRAAGAGIVHAFDEHAFLFARVAAGRLHVPAILTKCGGPPPHRYFPRVGNLVVFSREDREFFSNRGCRRLLHLPNRVRAFGQDPGLIGELRAQVGSGAVILRISRIARHYEKTLHDSVRLAGRLRQAGCDVRLVVVGRVYDDAVYSRLRDAAGDGVVWVTDRRFTVDAKRIIDVADIVIGTGRSLMEAVLRRRTVLCPIAGMSIPCLVTAANVEQLAAANFSERCRLSSDEASEFAAIVARVRLGQSAAERAFLDELARNHCDISAVLDRYRALYSDVAGDPERRSPDVLVHAAKVAFVFVRTGRRLRGDQVRRAGGPPP